MRCCSLIATKASFESRPIIAAQMSFQYGTKVSAMSVFSRIKDFWASAKGKSASAAGNQSETFSFRVLSESLEQMQALPEASLDTPYKAAALVLCALCVYVADEKIAVEMLNWLRGNRPLNSMELSFLKNCYRNDVDVPFSYFKGAVPATNYVPSFPLEVTIESNAHSDLNPGYKKLFLRSGGHEKPREIVLRQTYDGHWQLLEQFLLVGIRPPMSIDPWV